MSMAGMWQIARGGEVFALFCSERSNLGGRASMWDFKPRDSGLYQTVQHLSFADALGRYWIQVTSVFKGEVMATGFDFIDR